MRSPVWIKGLWGGTVLGATGLSLWAIDFATAGILGAIVAAPVVYYAALRGVTWAVLRVRPSRPHRWHLPLPLRGAEALLRDEVSGVVEARGEPLTAPFSGKPCLAYQVCVLFDTPNDARPPEWALHEARGADVTIGDTVIDGHRILLAASLEPIRHEDAPDLDLTTFLRQRGLFVTDGEFELFEARLAAGARVRAELSEGEAPVTLRVT